MEKPLGSADFRAEDDSKELTNNTLGKSKYGCKAHNYYYPSKSPGKEAQTIVASLLLVQNEDLDLIEATELSPYNVLNESTGDWPLPTGCHFISSKIYAESHPDDCRKCAVVNENLVDIILEDDLLINRLQKHKYSDTKIYYTITGYNPPQPLQISSPMVSRTSKPDFNLKGLFNIDEVDKTIFKCGPEYLLECDQPEVSRRKQGFYKLSNDNDLQGPSFAISSINCNSPVPVLLYKPDLLVAKENNGGLPRSVNDDDHEQASSANISTAVMIPVSLSAKVPTAPSLNVTFSNMYECRYCFILYLDEAMYLLHMHAHCIEEPFRCVCGRLCSTGRYDFNYHLLQRRHQLPVRFQIQVSPAVVLPLTQPLRGHLPMVFETPPSSAGVLHPTPTLFVRSGVLYECIQCKIMYRDFRTSILHMAFHSTISTFTCTVHEHMRFSDSYSFNAHLFSDRHIIPPSVWLIV